MAQARRARAPGAVQAGDDTNKNIKAITVSGRSNNASQKGNPVNTSQASPWRTLALDTPGGRGESTRPQPSVKGARGSSVTEEGRDSPDARCSQIRPPPHRGETAGLEGCSP